MVPVDVHLPVGNCALCFLIRSTKNARHHWIAMDVWSLTIKDVAHRIGSKEDTHLKITQLGAENAWECAGQEHLDDHTIKQDPVSIMQKTG